jgi:ATP-dependent DNA helicase RecQ
MAPTASERYREARALLARHYGYPHFRPAQRRVILSVLKGRNTLAVLPTGGGKSICFQVPALVLEGLTVVVSPLIALMEDQVAAARGRGLPAAALSSVMPRSQREAVLRDVARSAVRLLYLAPERLPAVTEELRNARVRCALLAVDEAHCISEWGHDFRPAYRRLRQWRARLGGPPVLALTGSATPAVREDIVRSLGMRDPDVHVASFDRPNIRFAVRRPRSEEDRLRTLKRLLWAEESMTLVYAPTRSLTEALARAVNRFGLLARPYHAGLTARERQETLAKFLEDRVSTVVATSAFGMGIDKPDVRLVVHWTLPATPESYYQEAGRAGRDGEPSRGVLLYRKGDGAFHRQQLGVTFPDRRLMEAIWAGRTPPGTPGPVLESARRLERELRPRRGPVNWRPVGRRIRAARARLGAMERYATTWRCRRRALLAWFGERLGACSGCDRCGG